MTSRSKTLSRISALALATPLIAASIGPAASVRPDAGSADPCVPTDGVFSLDFESFTPGTPALTAERDFRQEFCPAVRYIAGFGNDAEPPLSSLPPDEREERIARERAGQYNGASDTVRLTIDDATDGGAGQALRVLYPQGTNTSSHSGAQFEMPVPGAKTYDRESGSIEGEAYDELYLSYRVKVDDNFDWAQGGKLPGLWANDAAGYPEPANEVSARLMWRAGGALEFYLHTESDDRERLLWNNVPGAGHATLTQGQWHTIQFRLKLNTPGEPDGIWQGWLDGELVADYRDLTFRSSPEANLNTVFFSTFHGGSSGAARTPEEIWWPNRDGSIWFDDFTAEETQSAALQPAHSDVSLGND